MYKKILSNDNVQENVFTKKVNTISSEEGSIKLKSTGDKFIDDFASISKYKVLRDSDDIFDTMEELWDINPLLSIKETFYLRMISRQSKYLDGNKTIAKQIGAGLKHEFIYRLLWIANKSPMAFINNMEYIPVIGSWYDIFQILREYYSFKDKGFLPIPELYNFIIKNLKNKEVSDLIKKYLPTMKSRSNCTTLRNKVNNSIAYNIAYYMNLTAEEYRHLKSSGNAHKWQQCLSQQDFTRLDFSTIPGRALSKLIKGNFLDKHGYLIEPFCNWLEKQPTAKFTGYPYEIFYETYEKYKQILINKQFYSLLDNNKLDSNLICVVDTSGSMSAQCVGTNRRAIEVAKSMALYFSYMLKGKFNKTWLEFSNECIAHELKGKTPYAQFEDMSNYKSYGETNFLSVAKLFSKLKLCNDEKDFPSGIICLSDGEFSSYYDQFTTNFHEFKHILRSTGFSEEYVNNFKIILWDIPNTYYNSSKLTPKFESLSGEENFFYMSGFDPAGISFLFKINKDTNNIPKTAKELFNAAMDQEVLNKLYL
jgi:hypothetical protein